MILAANIEGQLLVLVLMVIFGIASWIGNKLNEKKQPPQTPRAPGEPPPRRDAAESEEERMRRFMEALGLPTDQPASPPQQQRPPAPQRPVERPRSGPPPIPPIVVPPPFFMPARPRPKQIAPPPIPAERSLDELETTSLPVEQITLPELVTSEVHEFETVTSSITAAHTRAPLLREAAPVSSASSVHALLRAALSSPEQLRSAFVLREILGPPPGLGK